MARTRSSKRGSGTRDVELEHLVPRWPTNAELMWLLRWVAQRAFTVATEKPNVARHVLMTDAHALATMVTIARNVEENAPVSIGKHTVRRGDVMLLQLRADLARRFRLERRTKMNAERRREGRLDQFAANGFSLDATQQAAVAKFTAVGMKPTEAAARLIAATLDRGERSLDEASRRLHALGLDGSDVDLESMGPNFAIDRVVRGAQGSSMQLAQLFVDALLADKTDPLPDAEVRVLRTEIDRRVRAAEHALAARAPR